METEETLSSFKLTFFSGGGSGSSDKVECGIVGGLVIAGRPVAPHVCDVGLTEKGPPRSMQEQDLAGRRGQVGESPKCEVSN